MGPERPMHNARTPRPAGACNTKVANHLPLLAGLRAGGATRAAFPKPCGFSDLLARAKRWHGDTPTFDHLPLRGQRRLGRRPVDWTSLLPV
jgi:hypothetical protein